MKCVIEVVLVAHHSWKRAPPTVAQHFEPIYGVLIRLC